MGMDANGPVYSVGSRASFAQWMGPGVVAYLAAHAFVTGQGIALVIAFPLAFYVAFTWHTGYDLYRDVLVFRYLWPRRMVVPVADIGLARQTRLFPAGEGLLLGRHGKAPLFLRPRDPARLRELLEQAIARRAQARLEQPQAEHSRPRRPRPKRRRPPRR